MSARLTDDELELASRVYDVDSLSDRMAREMIERRAADAARTKGWVLCHPGEKLSDHVLAQGAKVWLKYLNAEPDDTPKAEIILGDLFRAMLRAKAAEEGK